MTRSVLKPAKSMVTMCILVSQARVTIYRENNNDGYC
jgi:hypothetical protein